MKDCLFDAAERWRDKFVADFTVNLGHLFSRYENQMQGAVCKSQLKATMPFCFGAV